MIFKITTILPDSDIALKLSNELHAELENRYGQGRIEEFTEENKNMILFLLFSDENKYPAACGALKHYSKETVEIKRMFVRNEFRGKGISKLILNELEKHAANLKYKRIILETGLLQPEAMSLYEKFGYKVIDCYGQHAADPDGVCFEKIISEEKSE